MSAAASAIPAPRAAGPAVDDGASPGDGAALDARGRSRIDPLPALTYVASTAPGGPTLHTSPQASALLGYSPQEWAASPTPWLARIHADDRARVEAEWAAAHAAGRPFAAEYRVHTRDGAVLWFRDQAALVHDADGRPLCIQGVRIDITAHRETAEALRRSEDAIRALHRITASPLLSSSAKIRALLEMGSRRFGLPTGVLSQIAGGEFRVVECHSADGALAPGSRLALEDVFCGSVHGAETLSIDHASAGAWAAHRCCTRLGVEAYVGTPVAVGGDAFGTLCFFGSHPRQLAFTEGDRDFLRLMGEWVGAELERRRALEEPRAPGVRPVARDIIARRELDRIKDEFVSVVSHELRTPLTALRGSLGLLASGRMGAVPERGRRLLEIAVGNTDRLVRMINDILDVEGLESGRAALRMGEVPVARLVARAADAVAEEAARRGVQLAVSATAGVVRGDEDRLVQALLNLLGNALKFSPAGGVVTLAAETHGGELRLRVADQGRGIAADRLDSVFERFRQGDSSDARADGGTGLGLAICRGIVAQHGGRIWAESPQGEGATFRISLPLAVGETEPADAAQRGGAAFHLGADAPAVLVVEGDADLAGVLGELLGSGGVASHHVRTARDAEAAAAGRRFDAVILELELPDGDGLALVERLRAGGRLQGVPLLVYTARDADEAALRRLAAAEAAIFTKSRITPEAFRREVAARIGLHSVAAA